MLEMTGGKPACPAIVSTCLVWRRKAPVPGNPSLQRFRTTRCRAKIPALRGMDNQGGMPQRQAQRTSIPPLAGAAGGVSHPNRGYVRDAGGVPAFVNSRFRAG